MVLSNWSNPPPSPSGPARKPFFYQLCQHGALGVLAEASVPPHAPQSHTGKAHMIWLSLQLKILISEFLKGSSCMTCVFLRSSSGEKSLLAVTCCCCLLILIDVQLTEPLFLCSLCPVVWPYNRETNSNGEQQELRPGEEGGTNRRFAAGTNFLEFCPCYPAGMFHFVCVCVCLHLRHVTYKHF